LTRLPRRPIPGTSTIPRILGSGMTILGPDRPGAPGRRLRPAGELGGRSLSMKVRQWISELRAYPVPALDEQRGGEVDEGEVVLRLLLPPDEQLPAAVEPGGGSFDDPASRSRPTSTLPAFLAASADVGHVAAPSDRVFGIGVVVALIEAEMLLGVGRRAHDARIKQFADRLLVRPVRRSEGNGQGDAGGVGEMMPLGAALGTVGGIGPGFFTAQRPSRWRSMLHWPVARPANIAPERHRRPVEAATGESNASEDRERVG